MDYGTLKYVGRNPMLQKITVKTAKYRLKRSHGRHLQRF